MRRFKLTVAAAVALCATVVAGCGTGAAAKQPAGEISVWPPKAGETAITVTVRASGKPARRTPVAVAVNGSHTRWTLTDKRGVAQLAVSKLPAGARIDATAVIDDETYSASATTRPAKGP